MKTTALYYDPRSLNDATRFYVNIVKEVIEERGDSFTFTTSLKDLKNVDVIFTITGRYFVNAKLRYPFKKTIYWAQGVAAEEAKMANYGRFSYIMRYLFERSAVKHADLLLLVSKRMKEYYSHTYGYRGENYIIMPCFNQSLSSDFNPEQYKNPTFVYAGGASIWQGVDLMLDVYKDVEDSIPEAKITILSNQKDQFMQKIGVRDIKNYEIKYVKLEEMEAELHKHKYGFILRENHIVNNVATPTKMNSYLSVYLIPIFSDAVCDFAENIKLNEFTIMANCPLDNKTIARQIIDFENNTHQFDGYKGLVESIFDSHYNVNKYKSEISDALKRLKI